MNKFTLLGVKGGPTIRQSGTMPSSSLLRFGGQTVLIDCGITQADRTAQISIHWNSADEMALSFSSHNRVIQI